MKTENMTRESRSEMGVMGAIRTDRQHLQRRMLSLKQLEERLSRERDPIQHRALSVQIEVERADIAQRKAGLQRAIDRYDKDARELGGVTID